MKKSRLIKTIAIVGLFIITIGLTYYSIDLFQQDSTIKIISNEAFAYFPKTCYDGTLGSGQYALALHECKPGCPTDFYIEWHEDGTCQ